MDAVQTTCPYCGVGCGVKAAADGGGGAAIAGDPEHGANYGRLCSKGSALGETLDMEGRLLRPVVDGREVAWDEALDEVARRLAAIRALHGPEAIAFYVSGQLLTEDYYVANKLCKGFIGSPHLDTNSRLCMASAVAGQKRAFGADAVPASYEDIEIADLVVITGSNLAWCHPVLFQRLQAARKARPEMRVVCIDPRRTATAEAADLHLPLNPGSDAALFGGLLLWLADHGALDKVFLAAHASGLEEALQVMRESLPDMPAIVSATGLEAGALKTFYRWFEAMPRTVTLYSQGVNQSSSGVDKVNAILNVHLATGRIGKPGAVPFSITGQPNAMGGREVGALANQLAAHMDYAEMDIDRVRRFWRAPDIAMKPGLKALDMMRAVENGSIKAIWIMATNPAVSLPEAGRVRAALKNCPLVIISDCVSRTDSTDLAHVKLPALGWGEKDGTVTNSDRRISRQRAFLPMPGEARPDWWILSQVGRRMGFGAAFAYEGAADIFREHAALSAFENEGRRAFDIGAYADVSDAEYEAMPGFQWPARNGDRWGSARLFQEGRFYTPDGRARLVAVKPQLPRNAPSDAAPFALLTGRVRDQWHTMTRTGKSPRLSQHRIEPTIELAPEDIAKLGLKEGGFARVVSRWGQALGRVLAMAGQKPGLVFMPMHWSDQFATQGRANEAVNPECDPISGQPEFKHTPVGIVPWLPDWQGFLLMHEQADMPFEWWAKVRGVGHWRYELAGSREIDVAWRQMRLLLQGIFDEGPPERIDYLDQAGGVYRCAFLRGGRLLAVLCLAKDTAHLPARDWLGGLFVRENLSALERRSLLAGRLAQGAQAAGPLVCACFGVGRETIRRSIAAEKLKDTAAIGVCLKAGTNCGSCLPELEALLTEAKRVA